MKKETISAEESEVVLRVFDRILEKLPEDPRRDMVKQWKEQFQKFCELLSVR